MHKNGKKNLYVHEKKKCQVPRTCVFRVTINLGHMTYLGSGQNADSVLAIDVKQWVSPGPWCKGIYTSVAPCP